MTLKAFKNHKLNTHGDVSKIKFAGVEKFLSFLMDMEAKSRVRVDFNNQSSFSEIEILWESLKTSDKAKIDYFEDPYPKDDSWIHLQQMGIELASDRNKKDGIAHSIDIYKPNVDLEPPKDRRQIFSSYMGHDLGRYLCYLELMQKGDLNEIHGVDTPKLYQGQLELFNVGDDHYYSLNESAVRQLELNLRNLSWSDL